MSSKSFLGTGMKFPPQIDPGTGRFSLSSGAQSVRESVYLILMTQRGERWLEPEFGSRILSYTFLDISPTTVTLLTNELRALLLEQEPRISDVQVELDPETREGCLIFNLSYTITETNTRDNLVFPFYLNPGEGETDGGVS
ncbi:MAG TPA: GPW/gp25 family protein [Candidatus Gallacutalibacter pullicola]|uniref:GPW/gp25 family protein n=1 Tax=Candidatus Gallacutalibacter pullicola TaxID=2840830 RepID=A0A9D1J0J0_9FIRM|nr:GPW/gp25 family protein [Candidatus Gallacutalibacter pullicola]